MPLIAIYKMNKSLYFLLSFFVVLLNFWTGEIMQITVMEINMRFDQWLVNWVFFFSFYEFRTNRLVWLVFFIAMHLHLNHRLYLLDYVWLQAFSLCHEIGCAVLFFFYFCIAKETQYGGNGIRLPFDHSVFLFYFFNLMPQWNWIWLFN